MGTLHSLDAHRSRRRFPPGARRVSSIPAPLRETTAPVCEVCAAPIVLARAERHDDSARLLTMLRREGLCASCYAPF